MTKRSFHFSNSNVGNGPVVQIKDNGNLEAYDGQLEQGVVEEYSGEPWVLLAVD